MMEGAGELLAAATERAPVEHRSREPLNLSIGESEVGVEVAREDSKVLTFGAEVKVWVLG